MVIVFLTWSDPLFQSIHEIAWLMRAFAFGFEGYLCNFGDGGSGRRTFVLQEVAVVLAVVVVSAVVCS